MVMPNKESLFDPTLVTDLINKVKGKSSLAVLSKQEPVPFNGAKEFTFVLDSDVDVVAENGKKTEGGATVDPLKILPIKVEYGARFSDEFLIATDEEKIGILQAFNDGFAKKLARGLDIMAFHGTNPRTKQASSVIGENHFDQKITQAVAFDKADPDRNVESAVALIRANENDITGMALDPTFSSALADMRTGTTTNQRLFPELAWGANPGAINGMSADINSTVTAGSKDVAVIGDFANMFKWGYAKQIPLEVIQYGDPDNSGHDLKGYGQVYLRSEVYIGWGILDANSFARITTDDGAEGNA
jgi:hypothetical protein